MIPINRYSLGFAGIVALFALIWIGIAQYEANIRADVREKVVTEQMAEDLVEARADLEFQRDQTAKSEAAVKTLHDDLSTMAERILINETLKRQG